MSGDSRRAWGAAHSERAALAEDLASLTAAQWALPSLCSGWVIEDVVAHLTAAASIGYGRWLAVELRGATQTDRQSLPALILAVWGSIAGGLALSQWVAAGKIPDPEATLVLAGGVLMLLGLDLRFSAVHELGGHFTVRVTTGPDQPLVTSGP
ncbi:MAG: maleylpyruvate isomerase N-terminal domain-containing protein [Clostridia bacterium]